MKKRFASLRTPRAALTGAVAALVLTTCAPGLATIDPTAAPASPEQGPLSTQSVPVEGGEAAAGAVPTASHPEPPPLPEGARPPPAGPAPGTPAAGANATTAFEPVSVQRPRLRLHGVPPDRDTIIAEVAGVEGVSYATLVTVGEVAVAAPTGVTAVKVAAVDPGAFRRLTPQVTADAVEVWQRISEGDAAFLHDVGHRLELELGQRLPAAGHTTLRVGALASNGAPPVADAVVSNETGEHLRLEGIRSVFISLVDGVSAQTVAQRLQEATGLPVEILEEPATQRAFLAGSAARSAFEPFNYVSFGDGMIQIDSSWVRRNIVRAPVPVFGEVVCHRLLIPQLRGAMQEIVDRGLTDLINRSQYGGCWSPRHVLFNPGRSLSMHAWGLAIDFNVATNGYGARPQMDPRIVEIFDRWGFVWGGRWSTPDGMHFELGALLQSPG